MTATCMVCAGTALRHVLDVPRAPVFNNVLFDDERAARAAPLRDIELRVCSDCGHLQNIEFDPAAVEYALGYENPLHHSAVFSDFARSLARRLARDHLEPTSLVVEVGCGDGHF